MTLPDPKPGLVISYSYLWHREQQRGQIEGRKARPCVVIVAVRQSGNLTMVTVAPVTHSPPTDRVPGVELPSRVKAHLGLDQERSWVIVTEVNEFACRDSICS